MLKQMQKYMLLAIACLFIINVMAARNPNVLQTPLLVPTPPHINSKAYILIDATTGKILAEKNADLQLEPASLTKMMTLYLISAALQNGQIKLNDKVNISKLAWKTGGSKMFLNVGSKVPVKQLIQGIIVQSGNDASIAMAEYIAGSQNDFVKLMNKQAQLLGMNKTHFTDATGLPHPDHYTTARDMSILAKALVNDFPEYYHYYKEKVFTYNKITQHNRNRLLWRDKRVDGIKTGHTDNAGYCLVASGKQDKMRLITVVMGTPNDDIRTVSAQQLLNYGFRFYETVKLYSAGQTLSKAVVWKGITKTVPLGLKNDIVITIPRGQYKNLKADITIPQNLVAPIQKNQDIGRLVVQLNNKTITSKPLIALKNDPKGGLWTQMKDSLNLTLKSFLNG